MTQKVGLDCIFNPLIELNRPQDFMRCQIGWGNFYTLTDDDFSSRVCRTEWFLKDYIFRAGTEILRRQQQTKTVTTAQHCDQGHAIELWKIRWKVTENVSRGASAFSLSVETSKCTIEYASGKGTELKFFPYTGPPKTKKYWDEKCVLTWFKNLLQKGFIVKRLKKCEERLRSGSPICLSRGWLQTE